jgi:hypothetical protein
LSRWLARPVFVDESKERDDTILAAAPTTTLSDVLGPTIALIGAGGQVNARYTYNPLRHHHQRQWPAGQHQPLPVRLRLHRPHRPDQIRRPLLQPHPRPLDPTRPGRRIDRRPQHRQPLHLRRR